MDEITSGFTLERQHECEAISSIKDASISSVDWGSRWLLHLTVKRNTLYERTFAREIKYCPFCGERLPSSKMCEERIAALNKIGVYEHFCSGSECEYVLGSASVRDIKALLDVGFTSGQLEEAIELCGGNEGKIDIDLSSLAFNYTPAEWWGAKEGFTAHGIVECDLHGEDIVNDNV